MPVTFDATGQVGSTPEMGTPSRAKRKVAFFVRALDGGGAQRDMILLANALAAQGRPVEILTLRADGPLRALVDGGVTVATVAGGQLRSALPGLRRAFATRRPDVVISAEAASNLVTLLAARTMPRDRRPLVVLREVSSASISMRADPYLQTRAAYRLLRLAYRAADAVVTLTDGALRDLVDNFGVPPSKIVKIVSNAVLEDDWAEAPKPEGGREPGLVVAVGRLSPEKDLGTLLEAFATLPRSGRERLEIYGTGPERPALERAVVDLGIADRVSFMGFVLDPFPVFRRASLAVSSSRFEGFGNVLVEALSCGTPVVATDCPYGPAEILDGGRYGSLVPVGDAHAMANAITKALVAGPDRAMLRARAAPHTTRRAGEALGAIIDGLADRWSRTARHPSSERPQPETDPPGAGPNVGGSRASPDASRGPNRSDVPLRCRAIAQDDLDDVVALLMRGFPDRTEDYWRRGLARHAERGLPAEHARYGYVLDAGGDLVGVLLTLYSRSGFGDADAVRCNLSSWYVEPSFRSYATLLDRVATRRRDLMFLNVTPAPHTWAAAEARGFTRFCRGQVLAIPALSRPKRHVSIRTVDPDDQLADLPPTERTLVKDHLSYGCLCLVWSDGASSRPLVLQAQRIGMRGILPRIKFPVFQLIYCRSVDELPEIASALGRLLLRRHGVPWMLVDACGRIAGLPGAFLNGRRVKYSKGPAPMRLGDLAYTELVLFGP